MNLFNRTMAILFCCFISFLNLAKAVEFNGAIYVDQFTGIAGKAYNFSTIEKAKAGALQTCKKKSGKKTCTAIQLWSDGCGAAAWSPKNKSARGAISETDVKVAESKALDRCIRIENDSSCKIVASACTNWETVESTLIWW